MVGVKRYFALVSILLAAVWAAANAAVVAGTPAPQSVFRCEAGSLATEGTLSYIPPSGAIWDVFFPLYAGTGLASVLTASGSYREFAAASTFAWSPDGTEVAWVGDFTSGGGPIGTSALTITDTVTGVQRQLLPPSHYWVYDWSPDGRTLLIGASPNITPKTLEAVDISTGRVRPLLADVTSASFSPGSRLIEAMTNSGELDVIDLETGVPRVIAPAGSPIATGALSPDAQKLAFWDVARGLVAVDLASGNQTVVAPPAAYPGAPLWAPDSNHLAYAFYSGGGTPSYAVAVTAVTAPFAKRIGTAASAPPILSNGKLLWNDARSPRRGVVVAEIATGRVLDSFNPIPDRLRLRYRAIPAAVIVRRGMLVYSVGNGNAAGGYRTVRLDGRNDRRPFACRVNKGWVKVIGSEFSDRINVRNSSLFAYNTVVCGAGTDTVIADREDKVSGDCEHVIRR